MLLETLREPEAFRAALARAAEREIPVVALTVGGSPTGRAMVAAHSGALAGDDGAWEALFEAYGVLRVRDLDEMTDTLELFAGGRRATARPPAGAGSRPCTTREPSVPLSSTWPTRSGAVRPDLPATPRAAARSCSIPASSRAIPLDVWDTGADSRRLLAGSLLALASDESSPPSRFAVDLVPEFDYDFDTELAVTEASRGHEQAPCRREQPPQLDRPGSGGRVCARQGSRSSKAHVRAACHEASPRVA